MTHLQFLICEIGIHAIYFTGLLWGQTIVDLCDGLENTVNGGLIKSQSLRYGMPCPEVSCREGSYVFQPQSRLRLWWPVKRAFLMVAPCMWNTLPLKIRLMPSLPEFQQQLNASSLLGCHFSLLPWTWLRWLHAVCCYGFVCLIFFGFFHCVLMFILLVFMGSASCLEHFPIGRGRTGWKSISYFHEV